MLILVKFVNGYVHSEVQVERREQLVQLRKRLLAEIAELQQVVAVETNQVPDRLHLGRLQAVQRANRKILLRKLRLQQLAHVEHILVELLGRTAFLKVQRNLFIGEEHEVMNQYLANVVSNKLSFDGLELFIKGILCNFIVCAAAFVGMKLKEETAKTFIMMIIVMTFVLPGFEHSIANMGTFSMTFTALGTSISWSGVGLHMLLSTLGNIIGGSILLGLPIYLMIRPKKTSE